ncbi:MAG: TetR/AcrR family transcriptional regulator [Steroidobacteraceae bacterium]
MKDIRNTKQKIIEAAAELFVRNGFGNVSMDAVAEAAGYTKVTIYQHVDSKENLLLDCLKWRLKKRELHLDEYFAERQASISNVLDIFRWLSSKSGTGSFHGCAFLKASSEMAATLPAVRTIALEAKRLLRARIIALLTQDGIPDADYVGDGLSLLFEGAQALSLLEQSPRAFEVARTIGAEWISFHQPARPAVQLTKSKGRR